MGFTLAQRVLVVDDYPECARIMGQLLEIFGFEVTIAHDGRSALELAAKHAPHAVLMDLVLPDIDGFEVARRLRDGPATHDALLLALTGYSVDDIRRRPGAELFDHHLVKPVAPATLRDLLLRELAGPAVANH